MSNLLRLLAVVFVISGCATADKHLQSSYTEQDKQDVRHMLALGEVGKNMLFNFADSAQLRFYKKMLYRSGITEATNPQLFKSIEQARQQHMKKAPALYDSGPIELAGPVNLLTSFDTKDHINYTTSALSSIPGMITSSSISLGLFNQEGDSIGPAVTENAYVFSRDLQAATYGADAHMAAKTAVTPDTVNAMFAYFYQLLDGTLTHGYTQSVTANVVDSVINIKPMPCVMGQPVSACNNYKCSNSSIITVCMTRQTPACTYCSPGLVPNFMFPMEGYIIYSGNVNVGTDGKPNSGAFANVTVTRLPAGGGCDGIPIKGTFMDYVTVTGNKLSWNIGGALFQNNCLQSGDSVLFQLTIFVKVGNQPAFATITNAAKADPPTVKIPPMQIVSGCIAKGTMITMDNGPQKAIEQVGMLEKVKGKRTWCVEYNTIGYEPKPLIRIIDDKGHNLLVTEDHPVATPKGVKPIKHLQVKDIILTDKGDAVIVSLNKEKYEGEVWNLALDKCGANDAAPGNSDALFYANGILVGDSKMQTYFEHYEPRNHENILKVLPKEWQEDYLNSLKKKRP